jgi:Fe(3+) dicitrate transport protein
MQYWKVNLLKALVASIYLTGHVVHAEDAVELQEVNVVAKARLDVIGTKSQQFKQSSTSTIIEQSDLRSAHVMTTNEALRKVPGVVVRDEEGFGIRPNISIRGLNPTRSTKVMLLEDGIPLAYAPYGDNASYYYPSIDRFSRIEVQKGANQVKFGPQTIGGVINHITPDAPEEFGGWASLTSGNRDYLNARFNVGGNGMMLDYTHKSGQGNRDNTRLNIDDLNFKINKDINDFHAITFRANYFSENSQVGYSGLTAAEYRNFGSEYYPYANDSFDTKRYGTSLTHDWHLTDNALLRTNYYYSHFDRDWWRQSSNSNDNLGLSGGCTELRDNRINGLRVDPNTCQANQGRLRTYNTYGVEPRLTLDHSIGQLEAGVRLHYEEQDRRQDNGRTPTARSGVRVEDNMRETKAYSGFISNRFDIGNLNITPILRYEYIENIRNNKLNGQSGSEVLTEWVPGISAAYTIKNNFTIFGGVHKGFAPPRVEDMIVGNGSTEVSAEKSTNYELGLRVRPTKALGLETSAFYNDFDNLIAVGSVAANLPALSQGKARFAGLEVLGTYDFDNGIYSRAAYTWLPVAEQTSPFRRVDNNVVVGNSASGNRQPYAPENTITASFGYRMNNWDAMIEAVHVGKQFADFGETNAVNATGQNGEIPSYTIYNAAVNYKIPEAKTTIFLVGKNIFDKEYIVDRTRGILTGMPALIQIGARYDY